MERTFTATISSSNAYLAGVYRWMTGALALSGLTAFAAATSEPFISYIGAHPGMLTLILFAELGTVLYLSFRIRTMSVTAAVVSFLLYAFLTGLTLSTIFFVYTAASIVQAFAITALTFGALSIYGSTTKNDLSGWSSFLFMSLIGIIIASMVNLFLKSSMIDWVTSVGAVIIFAGLTAYDTQKLKYYGASVFGLDTRGAIFGALQLYLDFINLFLNLLRLMGNRRD